MTWLKSLLPRDMRAFVALWASIGGAMALTLVFIWIVRVLVQFGRVDPDRREQVINALANSNYGLLTIIGAILLSLGLAINRRTLKANIGSSGFEASGGDEPTPQTIAAAAAGAAAGATVAASTTSEEKP